MLPALRAACLALVLLPVKSCAHQPAARPEIHVEPLGSATDPLPARIGQLRLDAAWQLEGSAAGFGGISAARQDGERLLLLSDRSELFTLAWPLHPADRPFQAAILQHDALTDRRGQPLDAEALVLLADGTRLVSDEGARRLVRFAPGSSRPLARPQPVPGLSGGDADNEGIEALARLPDGSLLALREAGEELHETVRLQEDAVQPLRYRSRAGFKPTDGDVAGGYLFVLERSLSLLGGWQARVVAVPLADLPEAAGAVIEGRELALVSGARLGENYEGLAVTRDGGTYHLVLVSDDNFHLLQRTLVLELSWQPDAVEPVTAGSR